MLRAKILEVYLCGESGSRLAVEVINSARYRMLLFCFVSGWYWMIDERALGACQMGCFGVHNSLLPAYRGGAPLVWSMINGEAQVGATVFRMTKGMDDGEILHQWKIDVEPHWVITDVLNSIESSVAQEIGSIVVRYLNGDIFLRAQSDIGVSYAPQRREREILR